MNNTKLAQARLTACRLWPAATSAILSLVPVERPGLGTLAVDKHWRLYFDPEFLQSVDDKTAAVIVLHEVSHLLLRHHERAGGTRNWELWNIAADCAVNFRLQAEGHSIPGDWMMPARFQLPGNLSAEQYFNLLEDELNAARKQSAEQSSTGGDSAGQIANGAGNGAGDQPDVEAPEQAAGAGTEPDMDRQDGTAQEIPTDCRLHPGESGSCSDGQIRPWEDSPPAAEKEKPPVIEKHEQEQIFRRVAEAIESKGSGKGAWSSFVQNILHPKIDPRVLLTKVIRKAVDQTSGGHDDTSYRRPSRRPSIDGVIRPSRVAIVPRICVILDSSGSMNQRDLALAVGLIAKVLSGLRLRDGMQVVVGDSGVQSCEKVFDPKKLMIRGGGGTEMDRLIIEAANLEPRPQVIVVATDGYTDWPPEDVGVPVVACLTRQIRRADIPRWIQSIGLE